MESLYEFAAWIDQLPMWMVAVLAVVGTAVWVRTSKLSALSVGGASIFVMVAPVDGIAFMLGMSIYLAVAGLIGKAALAVVRSRARVTTRPLELS